MNSTHRWFGSVRGRLTITVTLLFAAVMTSGAWFLVNRAEATWIADLQAQDLSELRQLASNLESNGAVPPGDALPIGPNGTEFALTDNSGVVIAETPTGYYGQVTANSLDPVDGPGQQFTGTAQEGGSSDTQVTRLDVAIASETLTLTATSNLQPIRASVETLRRILQVLVPVLVMLVAGMAWLVAGRAFRPVAAITGQVEKITHDRLDERVPVPASHDEVAHLARTMNSMLDRLSNAGVQQRQFVSDASHELRSPVAASTAQLEVALAHPDDADWPTTAQLVLDEQHRLTELINDLLLLARLDEAGPVRHEELDLDDVVYTDAARPRAVTIDVGRVHATRVHGDRQGLTRVVSNLLDNAVRHASGRVEVELSTQSGQAVLAVEDDGRGVEPADRERVFDRFVRLDDDRTRASGGAGLGLALVHAIVTSHGGTVHVEDGASGGARFVVRLPLEP